MSIRRLLLDRPREWRPRTWIFQIHLWAGVAAALYVIVASVTGSALMLHEALTPASPRADIAGGERPIGPDAAIDALRGALPEFRAASLVMPREEGGAFGGVLLSRGQWAFAEVHPATGSISRLETRDNSTWRFIADLHNNLLSGRTGRVVNGIGGLALTLLCLTGIVVWWPGSMRWRRGLSVDWRARWPRRLWDLHGATGIWLLPLTLVITITGVYHTWPQWFRASVAAVLPVSAPQPPLQFAAAESVPPARIEALIAAARAAVPDKRLHVLQLPPAPTQPMRALMMDEDEHVQAFADVVLLHPSSARVVRIDRYDDLTSGDRAIRWLGVLHAGHFAGAASATIWFIAGLGMAMLAASGLAVWWNRVVRRRISNFSIQPVRRAELDAAPIRRALDEGAERL